MNWQYIILVGVFMISCCGALLLGIGFIYYFISVFTGDNKKKPGLITA
jgi:Na+/melibiose symporter-like transporter